MSVAYEYHKITVKAYLDKLAKGEVNTQASYQRGEVKAWNKADKMTAFHESVTSGRYIPPMLFRTVDGKMESIDGNQRSRCLLNIHLGIGINLPLDETFYERELDFLEVLGADDEEVQRIFYLLNKEGEKMTLSQVRHGEYFKKLICFLNHPVWDVLKFENSTKESVLMQVCNSLWSDVPDFSSKSLVTWFIGFPMDDTKNSEIVNRLDVLEKILTVKTVEGESLASDDAKNLQKACKKVHIETLLSVLTGKETESECDKINLYLIQFFSQHHESRTAERIAYVQASAADSAASKNIKMRHDVMRMVINGDKTVYQPKETAKKETVPLKPDTKKSKDETVSNEPDSDYVPGTVYYAVSKELNEDGKTHKRLVQAEPTCKGKEAAKKNLIEKFKKPARSADLKRWNDGGMMIESKQITPKTINPIVTVQPVQAAV